MGRAHVVYATITVLLFVSSSESDPAFPFLLFSEFQAPI